MVNEREQNKAEMFALSNKLNKFEDENDDLRNRSMRSTLIFRDIPEEEQNDSWENVKKHLVNTLVKKLRLDWIYRLVEHIGHQKMKVNQCAGRYSPSLLTGAMLMTLEDDSQASCCKTIKHHCHANVYKTTHNEKERRNKTA